MDNEMQGEEFPANKRRTVLLINRLEVNMTQNIHSTVASIGSLVGMLTNETIDKEEGQRILRYLTTSAQKLDLDIRDAMRDVAELKERIQGKN